MATRSNRQQDEWDSLVTRLALAGVHDAEAVLKRLAAVLGDYNAALPAGQDVGLSTVVDLVVGVRAAGEDLTTAFQQFSEAIALAYRAGVDFVEAQRETPARWPHPWTMHLQPAYFAGDNGLVIRAPSRKAQYLGRRTGR